RQREVLRPQRGVVADDEALDPEALAHRRDEARAGPRVRIVIFGDHAAHDHAAEIVEQRKHRALYRAADILEIDIDALRASDGERGGEVAAMVEAGIETELLGHVAAFLGAAGDADDAATLALSELSGDRADRPRRGGDDNRLAGPGLADRLQPD